MIVDRGVAERALFCCPGLALDGESVVSGQVRDHPNLDKVRFTLLRLADRIFVMHRRRLAGCENAPIAALAFPHRWLADALTHGM